MIKRILDYEVNLQEICFFEWTLPLFDNLGDDLKQWCLYHYGVIFTLFSNLKQGNYPEHNF